jgi:hypothetical protein
MDWIVHHRRTIQRPLDQRTPPRPLERRWLSRRTPFNAPHRWRSLTSDATTGGHCSHHLSRLGRSSPPPSIVLCEVAVAATTRASGWHDHHRLCLGQSRPPWRSCLGPPLANIAWGCRSLTSPGTAARRSRLTPREVVIDVRPPLATARTSRGCSRCQALKPRSLGVRLVFIDALDLVRLNWMARQTWGSSSYWKTRAGITGALGFQ